MALDLVTIIKTRLMLPATIVHKIVLRTGLRAPRLRGAITGRRRR
jgi:hypothetical protein